MRLETEDGQFVMDAEPVIGAWLPVTDVVFWGTRVFLKVPNEEVWRETVVTVVE